MQNSRAIKARSRSVVATSSRELSWSFILLVIACTCVVAAGFFFAARQHFTSMDYGIKYSNLREQMRTLEAEQRRLLLAREVASSPLAIRKAARGLGLEQPTHEVATVRVQPAKPVPATTVVAVPVAAKKHETQKVVRTVMSAPIEPKASGETRTRVVESKKDRKDKSEVAAL
jgi:hypothetical protein